MNKNYNDLMTFITVAREGSFTKAAGILGVSQSALSHTVKALEKRLDVRLLHRTTRSISPTQAGEQLLQSLAPKFEEIDFQLDLINDLKDKPAGTIRINAAEHAINYVLWPKLRKILWEYPDITIEISINYGFVDIVSERFDAGVRLGESLNKDMIGVPISPPMQMAVVGSPAYFDKWGVPQNPADLVDHNCINIRLPTMGGLYAWEFKKGDKVMNVNVTGQAIFNNSSSRLVAALDGVGLAFLPSDMADEYLKRGELVRVLEDWCPSFDGYYLYYPNRQLSSPAFKIVVDSLRLERDTP